MRKYQVSFWTLTPGRGKGRRTICICAAACVELPPRIAPVIIPGMEMRPITLIWLTVGSKLRPQAGQPSRTRGSFGFKGDLREAECFAGDGNASFRPASTMCEVGFDLVPIVHELLQHHRRRDRHARYGVSGDHSPESSRLTHSHRLQKLKTNRIGMKLCGDQKGV